VGWGGTYGHLREAVEKMNEAGHKIALAHFRFISPLPENTASILGKFKNIIVAEQNNGQFAGYLTDKIPGLKVSRYNKVEGQPFSIHELIETFTKKLEA
jgi:2-oxoglutarate ferredoxin oxidoreductase subunit alpha